MARLYGDLIPIHVSCTSGHTVTNVGILNSTDTISTWVTSLIITAHALVCQVVTFALGS